MSENGPALVIRDLEFKYHDGSHALKGINLDVSIGEAVGILGPNGAGKSTLALHFNGILTGTGTVTVMGLEMNKKNLREIRNRVGLLFQDPDDQLFSPTVKEDVGFGPLNQGLTPEEAENAVSLALKEVGMEGSEARSPHHMSFGEKKRVALATVLSMKPRILVLDEPTSNFDPRGRREFIEYISTMETTKIIITHDLDMARKVCSRLVIMDSGTVVADGEASIIGNNEELLFLHGLI